MKNGIKLGFLIKRLHGTFEANRNNFFRQYDMTSSQMDILEFLDLKEEKMATIAEIHEYLGVSYATVSGIVKRLEQKKFVDKKKDHSDKRITYVMLCKNKDLKQLFDAQHAYLETLDQKLTANFTDEEENTLIYLLNKLYVNNEV